MTWENYPPDRSWLTMECANCGRGKHALGEFCYPVAFWLTMALCVGVGAAIVIALIIRLCW